MGSVIIAESWRAFEWWCSKNNVDGRDRKVVIPLIRVEDRYRLYGRQLAGWQVVKVGRIEMSNYKVFADTLREQGAEVNI